MIPRWFVVLLSTILCSFVVAPACAIVDGYVDGSTHPFVGAVDIRLAGAPIVASGTLISPTVLVTAGHVTAFFDNAGQTRARVTFDPVVSESGTWYWGTVHTDPRYPGHDVDPYDIGVIVFDAPIPGITPVLLPTENFLDQFRGQGHQHVIFEEVGYGVSLHVGGPHAHGLPSYTGDGTRKFEHEEFVTVENAWLNGTPLDGHVCYGDSGGPVLLGDVAVAIHKTSPNPNYCTGNTFDMRLDTAAHRAFLGQYVVLP